MKYLFGILFLSCSVAWSIEPITITNEEALARLKKVITNPTGPYHKRVIERIGNKTIQFEAFINIEADGKLAPAILGDFKNFPNWTIKNINQKPGGGTYYVKIQELKIDAKDNSMLHGFFNIDMPVFKSKLHGVFKLTSEQVKDIFTVRGTMVPDPNSILESAEAVLKSFPTEKPSPFRLIYVQARVAVRNWLLYEAFPERLLNRESGERIQIVLDNYQKEEDRLRSN